MKAMRGTIWLLAAVLLVGGSYAAGLRLRRMAPTTLHIDGSPYSMQEASLGGGAAVPGGGQGYDISPADTFSDVLDKMRTEYVDRIEDESKLGAGAVRAMLYSLDDPRTRYWDTQQYSWLKRQMGGEATGIGASLAILKQKVEDVERRRVSIVAPVPGGPADRAGLRAGDIVTEINGHWVIAYDPRLDLNRAQIRTLDEKDYRKIVRDATKRLAEGVSWPRALEQLMSPTEAELKLTVERDGAKAPLSFTVRRGVTRFEPAEFRDLPGGRRYVRITLFTPEATAVVKHALSGTAGAGGVVVDLRDNAGGPVIEGQNGSIAAAAGVLSELGVAGQFGSLARGAKREALLTGLQTPKSRPLAVLVNRGTANLAEIVALALKDKAGATLIGSGTLGDGVFQKLVPLKSGGAMTVASGAFLTSAGKPLGPKGTAPAVQVATGGPRFEGDPAVSKAVTVLASRKGG